MGTNYIPLIEAGIGLIMVIIVLLFFLYIYLTRPKKIQKEKDVEDDLITKTSDSDEKNKNSDETKFTLAYISEKVHNLCFYYLKQIQYLLYFFVTLSYF